MWSCCSSFCSRGGFRKFKDRGPKNMLSEKTTSLHTHNNWTSLGYSGVIRGLFRYNTTQIFSSSPSECTVPVVVCHFCCGCLLVFKNKYILLILYQDPRFNAEVDKSTGYRTHSILCMPIKSHDGEVKSWLLRYISLLCELFINWLPNLFVFCSGYRSSSDHKQEIREPPLHRKGWGGNTMSRRCSQENGQQQYSISIWRMMVDERVPELSKKEFLFIAIKRFF